MSGRNPFSLTEIGKTWRRLPAIKWLAFGVVLANMLSMPLGLAIVATGSSVFMMYAVLGMLTTDRLLSERRQQIDEELRRSYEETLRKVREAAAARHQEQRRVDQRRIAAMQVLELGDGFSMADLKTAFRKAARKAHPDAGGSDTQFHEVKTAFEYLKARMAA